MRFFFKWFDFWIGAYFDRKEQALYVCPLPMIGVRIQIGKTFHEEWMDCQKVLLMTKRVRRWHSCVHFCPEYDQMLIHSGTPEFNQGCTCYGR